MLKALFTVAADDKFSNTFLDMKALHWIKKETNYEDVVCCKKLGALNSAAG